MASAAQDRASTNRQPSDLARAPEPTPRCTAVSSRGHTAHDPTNTKANSAAQENRGAERLAAPCMRQVRVARARSRTPHPPTRTSLLAERVVAPCAPAEIPVARALVERAPLRSPTRLVKPGSQHPHKQHQATSQALEASMKRGHADEANSSARANLMCTRQGRNSIVAPLPAR